MISLIVWKINHLIEMQHMACYIKLTPTKYHALAFDSDNSNNLMVNGNMICFVLMWFLKI